MTGAELIAAERQRQIETEGWTPEHDDEHDDAELMDAAACYLQAGSRAFHNWPLVEVRERVREAAPWPWDAEWWKPSPEAVPNLVKAGALIAAEIDRLQRAEDLCFCGDYRKHHANGGKCRICGDSTAPWDGCQEFREAAAMGATMRAEGARRARTEGGE